MFAEKVGESLSLSVIIVERVDESLHVAAEREQELLDIMSARRVVQSLGIVFTERVIESLGIIFAERVGEPLGVMCRQEWKTRKMLLQRKCVSHYRFLQKGGGVSL